MDENKREDQAEKALTRIRVAYTLCGTPESDSNETESLTVKNFLDILAEVSLSIATRQQEQQV